MIKVIITEEGKSNKPVAFLSLQTQAKVIDHWAEMLLSNPDKYNVQIVMEYRFSKCCSENWNGIFGSLLLTYKEHVGKLTEKEVNLAFVTALQGIAFNIELEEKGYCDVENDGSF